MAIQFARIEHVQRSAGANACCKGAYNARGKVRDERTGKVYNFQSRGDNVYHEIILPEYVDEKFKDIEVFMNEVERAEKRKDSVLLKDVVLALPDDKELNLADRVEITRRLIGKREWVKEGLGVQVDIHEPHNGESNWHAHLLITTRRFLETGKGLSRRKAVDLEPKIVGGRARIVIKEDQQIHEDLRDIINDYFKELGLENRVDAIGIISQEHIGPVRMRSILNAAILRNDEKIKVNEELSRTVDGLLERVTKRASVFNRRDLEQLVGKLGNINGSVGGGVGSNVRDDVRSNISDNVSSNIRYNLSNNVSDNVRDKLSGGILGNNGSAGGLIVDAGVKLVEDVLGSSRVVPLYYADGKRSEFYTTEEVRNQEEKLLRFGEYISSQKNVLKNSFQGMKGFGEFENIGDIKGIEGIKENEDFEVVGNGGSKDKLDKELTKKQIEAFKYLMNSEEGLRILKGRAGTGKSRVLGKVAESLRLTSDNSTNEVIGLAPTHKARQELERVGFENNYTIKGFLFKLKDSKVSLRKGSLIVVDEAGMVSNKDYGELMRVASSSGCNVILSGDERQLSSIDRGGMFEVYADKFGHFELSDIRRQGNDWGKQVAKAFSVGDAKAGIAVLRKNYRLVWKEDKLEAVETLLNDWNISNEVIENKLIIAVKNSDVDVLNYGARYMLKVAGKLGDVDWKVTKREKGSKVFEEVSNKVSVKVSSIAKRAKGLVADLVKFTGTGKYAGGEKFGEVFGGCKIEGEGISEKNAAYYSVGDRVVFTESRKDLGISNGDFGFIIAASYKKFEFRLDKGEEVSFDVKEFCGFKHGYASTVYKAQGASIKDVYVLHDGFSTMRNSYVAMSRHVEDLHFYTHKQAAWDDRDLVSQLAFDCDKGSSIKYMTREEIEKIQEELNKSFLQSGADMLMDLGKFVGSKVTKFLDKSLRNEEYYKFEKAGVSVADISQTDISQADTSHLFLQVPSSEECNTNQSLSLVYEHEIADKYVDYKKAQREVKSSRYLKGYKGRLITFAEVSGHLSSSHYEQLFRQYANSINTDGKIKKQGRNISCGSISMNLATGLWIRFSTNEGGDIYHFVERALGVDRRGALEHIADLYGISGSRNTKGTWDDNAIGIVNAVHNNSDSNNNNDQYNKGPHEVIEWAPMEVIPETAVTLNKNNKLLQNLSKDNEILDIYHYRNIKGELIGATIRCMDKQTGKKQVLPASYCKLVSNYNELEDETAWRIKGFTDKGYKPIYRGEKLKEEDSQYKPVLIVEGEKTANVASKLLPEYTVVSWLGGTASADKVNWSVLKDREVIIWPDLDAPGIKAAETIAHRINLANEHCGMVTQIDPEKLEFNSEVHENLFPEKWDLADEFPTKIGINNIREAINNFRTNSRSLEKTKELSSTITGVLNNKRQLNIASRVLWQERSYGRSIIIEETIKRSLKEAELEEWLNSKDVASYVKYIEAKEGVSVPYNVLHKKMLISCSVRADFDKLLVDIKNDNEDYYIKFQATKTLLATLDDNYQTKVKSLCMNPEYSKSYEERFTTNNERKLYNLLVRDITLLHQEQLGHDLSQHHHEKIAKDVYNEVESYTNGTQGLDQYDKSVIQGKISDSMDNPKWWQALTNEQLDIAKDKVAKLQATNEEILAKFESKKQQEIENDIEYTFIVYKEFVNYIREMDPEYNFSELKSNMAKVDIYDRVSILETAAYEIFKANITPKLQELKESKLKAKTIPEFIKILKKEKDFCFDILSKYSDLSHVFYRTENNNHLMQVSSMYKTDPELIRFLKRDTENINKLCVRTDFDILEQLRTTDSLSCTASSIFNACKSHISRKIETHFEIIDDSKYVLKDGMKLSNKEEYLEYMMLDRTYEPYLKEKFAHMLPTRSAQEIEFEQSVHKNFRQDKAVDNILQDSKLQDSLITQNFERLQTEINKLGITDQGITKRAISHYFEYHNYYKDKANSHKFLLQIINRAKFEEENFAKWQFIVKHQMKEKGQDEMLKTAAGLMMVEVSADKMVKMHSYLILNQGAELKESDKMIKQVIDSYAKRERQIEQTLNDNPAVAKIAKLNKSAANYMAASIIDYKAFYGSNMLNEQRFEVMHQVSIEQAKLSDVLGHKFEDMTNNFNKTQHINNISNEMHNKDKQHAIEFATQKLSHELTNYALLKNTLRDNVHNTHDMHHDDLYQTLIKIDNSHHLDEHVSSCMKLTKSIQEGHKEEHHKEMEQQKQEEVSKQISQSISLDF